jgi:hypothetical protein
LNKKWYLSAIIAVVAVALSSGSAGCFTLAKDGNAACVIVLADKPSEGAKIAADELQHYVEKMSGAKLEIRSESDSISGPRVLIGRSKLTDAIQDLKIPAGLTRSFREEGFVIYCKGDTLVLAGNDAVIPDNMKVDAPGPHGWDTVGKSLYFGTRYATYELLNRLGVRWFVPGEYGEVVPKSATLTVRDMSLAQSPSLVVRYHGAWGTQAMTETRDLWLIRNKMNPRSSDWFGVPADSSLYGWLPHDKVRENPEWFALQPDGTRNPGLPCMADELRRNDPKYAGQPRLLDVLSKQIDDNVAYGSQVIAFSPDDGTPTCECDLCRKMSIKYSDGMTMDTQGNPVAAYLTGNEYFFFVNGLLNEAGKKHPGYLIATNGYANRYVPPENIPGFNKYNNLTIMFADIVGCTIHRYNDPKCWQNRRQYNLLKRWCKLTDKVWIYGYNYTMLVSKDTVTSMVKRIRANIPLTKEAGCLGFSDLEFTDISQLGIPTYVVRAALEWNTKVDVDAVLADYYDKWFGPAAKPMQDFYDALETAFDSAPYHGHEDVILSEIYTPLVMSRLADDIVQAERAAVAEPQRTHVQMERLIFDHLSLYVDSLKAKNELRFADAAICMRQMLATKNRMKKINEFFGWLPGPYNMDWEADRMARYARMTDGAQGRMFAPLPESAKFSADRYDVGRSDRWMEPTYNDSKWQMCSTSTGWQNQKLKTDEGIPTMTPDGHPYQGYAWYRFAVNTPEVEQGKRVRLFCPAVVDQVWVYVNGKYAGRNDYTSCFGRPQEADIDVTPYLETGKNIVALRVLCTDEYYGANGVYERPFLYTAR